METIRCLIGRGMHPATGALWPLSLDTKMLRYCVHDMVGACASGVEMAASHLFEELKRRNVLRAAVLYAGAVWAISQGISQLTPAIGLPDFTTRWFLIACVIGFPFWVAFAWFYEFTPQGFKRESEVAEDAPARHSTARKLDFAIIGVLIVAVVLLLTNQLVWHKGTASDTGSNIADIPAKSIAVLPFANLSGDPKNAYFSDGITVEILNALTQVPGLKVAGRTSAFQFNGKNEDLRKVGETLGVATVLEGSVQRSGDQVRITAQLVDTYSGFQLWSEKYDRKLTSIFVVEDEISKAIADKLRVQLAGGGQPVIRSKTDDPQAHALYLQGIAKITQRGPALKDAVALFEQATARDPDYAAAWAGLSQAYELLPWYNLGDWRESLVKAESAAQRALVLNPQLGEAHAALANVLRDRLDFADAIRQYQQALVFNPGSSEIHNQYAQLLGAIGQFDAANEHERIAVSLDPLAPNPRYILGNDLLAMHRYPDAIAEFRKVLDQTPDYTYARFELAFANLYAGHNAAAETAARAATLQLGEDPANIETLIKAFADPTLRPDALKRIGGMHQIGEIEFGELAQAYWYGLFGMRDRAIESLQRWVTRSAPGETFNGIRYLWMPAFDPIRDDTRFKAVLKKMGLPYQPAPGEKPPAATSVVKG